MTLSRSSLAVMLAALVAAGCSDNDSSSPMDPGNTTGNTNGSGTAPEPMTVMLPAGSKTKTMPEDVGLGMAGASQEIEIAAGGSRALGDIKLACGAGEACTVMVMNDLGMLKVTYTSGMVTAEMMPMYPPVNTPTVAALDFLNDEMLPPRADWENPDEPPMTKKDAYAAVIKNKPDDDMKMPLQKVMKDEYGHIHRSSAYGNLTPAFGMGDDEAGDEYVSLKFGDRTTLFPEGMSALSPSNGFAGYSLDGSMPVTRDAMFDIVLDDAPGGTGTIRGDVTSHRELQAYVFSDGVTHFGLWAADYDVAGSQDGGMADLGVFADLSEAFATKDDIMGMAGSTGFQNPVAGGNASYSGAAAGFAAGDMNGIWTGTVKLNANFADQKIDGMIRSNSIPDITLRASDILVGGMPNHMGQAEMAGVRMPGTWGWWFGMSGESIIGTVDVSNVIGAYGADRTQ